MMNCKDLLRIVNPSILEMYPQIYGISCRRNFKSMESNMRILAINMIMDGAY